MTRRSDAWLGRLAAAALLAAMAGCATAPVGTRGGTALPFPSPLSGPGHPPASERARNHIDRGWRALLAGHLDEASHRAVQAGATPAARLLSLQAKVLEDPGSSLQGLHALVEAQPEYASAWITLSFAAEKAGEEHAALTAAHRAAELWGSQRWIQRAAGLEDRWVGSRLAQASSALEAGDAEQAARLARAALAAEPGNRRAILVLARAQLDAGKTEAALAELGRLEGDPDALLLEGRIAEQGERWAHAMELYQQLPDTDPRRKPALERVKQRWRIANLPGYVQAAITSPSVTRGQLAVLLGNLLPELLSIPVGDVPLISDIVDLPSQREIVAVVAAGLMAADPIEHTFAPRRRVTAADARKILTAALLRTGRPAPRWCQGTTRQPGCFLLSDPPTGQQVTSVLMSTEEGAFHE